MLLARWNLMRFNKNNCGERSAGCCPCAASCPKDSASGKRASGTMGSVSDQECRGMRKGRNEKRIINNKF